MQLQSPHSHTSARLGRLCQPPPTTCTDQTTPGPSGWGRAPKLSTDSAEAAEGQLCPSLAVPAARAPFQHRSWVRMAHLHRGPSLLAADTPGSPRVLGHVTPVSPPGPDATLCGSPAPLSACSGRGAEAQPSTSHPTGSLSAGRAGSASSLSTGPDKSFPCDNATSHPCYFPPPYPSNPHTLIAQTCSASPLHKSPLARLWGPQHCPCHRFLLPEARESSSRDLLSQG